MFQKLAYLKSISLLMLAGKIFKDYEMFSWFEIVGVVVLPALFIVIFEGLLNKAKTWAENFLKDAQ